MLAAGRVFSGVALGLAMAVGGSWIKELSSLPWGEGDGGARRAAMSLTAGFGVGAGVAGVLAQWGPWPAVLPALLVDQAQRAPVAFSALLCVVTLGCGFVIQSLGRRIDTPGGVHAVAVALIFLVPGVALAGPDDLAGLTAVFYSVSYLGFAVPVALAMLAGAWPDLLTYSVMFGIGGVAAVACLVIVTLGHRAHRPQSVHLVAEVS